MYVAFCPSEIKEFEKVALISVADVVPISIIIVDVVVMRRRQKDTFGEENELSPHHGAETRCDVSPMDSAANSHAIVNSFPIVLKMLGS